MTTPNDLDLSGERQAKNLQVENVAGLRRIGVLTSGGDAPGMNAAVRAVVRTAAFHGLETVGIRRGFNGLHDGEMGLIGPRDVANIIQRGGTRLLTARSQAWMTPEGRAQGAEHLRHWEVDGLVVIGGDGSFQGAHLLAQEHGIRVLGVPGTIDNDLYGTDYTIGYHTAVQTALDAVDRLRDTGASHERIFVIEVMGRHAGHIAVEVALAGGAEEVLVPERPADLEAVADEVQRSIKRGKTSSIIIVAEGFPGGAEGAASAINERIGEETRVSILGHIQRGGSPVARDRVLASVLGRAATEALMAGRSDVMVGEVGHTLNFVPLEHTWTRRKDVTDTQYDTAKLLSI